MYRVIGLLALVALVIVPIPSAATYASRYAGHDGAHQALPRQSCEIRITFASIEIGPGIGANLEARYDPRRSDAACVRALGKSASHVYRLDGAALDADRIRLTFRDCADDSREVRFDGTIDNVRVAGNYDFAPGAPSYAGPRKSLGTALKVPLTLQQFVAPSSPRPTLPCAS
jgi:hypothetical protein